MDRRILFVCLALIPAGASADDFEHRFLRIFNPLDQQRYFTGSNVAGVGYFYFFKEWQPDDLRIRVRLYRPVENNFELFQERDAQIGAPLGGDLASLQYLGDLKPKEALVPGKYLYRVDCFDKTGTEEKLLATSSVFITFVGRDAPTDDEIVVVRDIPYREGASKHWRLDLAMQKSLTGKPRPGIVVVHGGGWLEGDKSSFVFKDRTSPANIVDFARLGFVAVTINYRLSPEAPFPAALEDCKCAVRWLRAHTKEYNLDREHIGAWGNSAGGHLALLLAMVGKDAGLEGDGPYQDESSLVQAAVSDSGPVDMIHQARDSAISEVVKRFMGGAAEGERALAYRQASPNNYIKADSPPLLLIYGVSDDQVPIATADEFVLALGKAGAADVTYHRLAYVYHCPHSLVAIPEMQRAVDDFFVRTLLHPETAREVRRRKP
jgi:acetyl esterase/lipase